MTHDSLRSSAIPISTIASRGVAKNRSSRRKERAEQRKQERRQGQQGPRVREYKLTEVQAQEFARIVRDDLVFLQSLNYRTPSRTEVRIASSILRRLLHEEMLFVAWQIAGLESQPVVQAIDLQAVLADVPARYIHYAYAGGAKTEGANHRGYVLLVVPRAEAEAEGHEAVSQRVSKLFKPGVMGDFPLTEFVNSPALISGEASVSRLQVVRYVANKLGGVHWDNRRGQWTDVVGSRHRLLDEDHVLVGRLSGALYEVLSIAQAIATSADIARLIERVVEIAPEPEYDANVLKFREGRIGKYADMTFTPKPTTENGPKL